jgi:hypothetical protein
MLYEVKLGDQSGNLVLSNGTDEVRRSARATRLPGARHPAYLPEMTVNEVHVGDYLDAEEVLAWLREECKSTYEIHYAEVEHDLTEGEAAEGLSPLREFKFFFRFNNMNDALRFKLQFGHVLDAGVTE